MSTVCTLFTGRLSRSSSLSGRYFTLVYSNPRTTSSQGTAFSSLGHQRTFFRRTPSFLWSRWNRTSCDSVAVWRLTGMLTIPNEIVPLQIARGALRVPSAALAGLRAVLCAIPDIKGITMVFAPPAVSVGVVILGERLHLVAVAGILLLLGGIWAVRRPTSAGAALGPAVLTGILIAAYTSLDRVGVRLGPPWLYGWLLWLFAAIFLLVFTRTRRVTERRLTDELGTSLAVGVLMTAAYFMILFALSIAPLAIVAPLRESAIVLVTAWGIWRLGERHGAWLRVGGALAIVAGIALLTIS